MKNIHKIAEEILAKRMFIPANMKLGVIPRHGGHLILIATEQYLQTPYEMNKLPPNKDCVGEIFLESFRTQESRYFNGHSEAESGYGPTLYDAAIIVATKFGGGFVSSECRSALVREGMYTSDKAQSIYQFYYQNRPDVDKKPLTPTEINIVKQSSRAELLNSKPYLFTVYTSKKRLSSLGPVWSGTKL